jgi:type IV pilus assembly protein PilV
MQLSSQMILARRNLSVRLTCRGFSLLEVLITIVVVAIGLLGVAGMQVSSIKLADLAQTRATGVALANDIVDRIRANRGNALGYTTSFGGAPSAIVTQQDRDLKEWKENMADRVFGLPEGDGSIQVQQDPSCDTIAGRADCFSVSVTIRWSESRVRGVAPATPKQFTLRTRV